MKDYKSELDFITSAIRQVYGEVMSNGPAEARVKAAFDEVTDADIGIENGLIALIKERYPDANILSEELNSDEKLADGTWIIDPIDGTCNFAHRLHQYGVQCALYDEGDIVLGAIYLPYADEMFTAVKGGGAWLNGERIFAVKREPSRSLISFGDFVHADPALVELEHRIMTHVAGVVERVRMYGACSIDFTYAAAGRIDGNFTFVNNQWDIAPGILLCREAGMLITDAYGRPYTRDSQTLAVFTSEELRDACVGY